MLDLCPDLAGTAEFAVIEVSVVRGAVSHQLVGELSVLPYSYLKYILWKEWICQDL